MWGVPSVKLDELPALRQSSDIAWGLWNRHSKESLSNINYFFTVAIVNTETRKIISRAMDNAGQRILPKAPGYTFRAGNENFLALLGMYTIAVFSDMFTRSSQVLNSYSTYTNYQFLGSPNLVAAMYFLLQHKPQFGHNRWVTEIRVFLPNGALNTVSMLVKVERAPAPPPVPPEPIEDPGREKKRSSESAPVSPLNIDSWKGGERADSTLEEMNLVRRHIIWA